MVECPSGLRSTPRKRVRFLASESSNLSSTAPWDSKRFLESLFSCGSPPFFRAVATVQRSSSVLQSIAKGYKTTSGAPIKPPPRRRSETVIVRRQEKGDEKHGDRGCGKLEKTERSDSPPTPLQQKRRLDTTRLGRPAKTGQRACMFAALLEISDTKISGSRCNVDVPPYIARILRMHLHDHIGEGGDALPFPGRSGEPVGGTGQVGGGLPTVIAGGWLRRLDPTCHPPALSSTPPSASDSTNMESARHQATCLQPVL